MDIKDTSKTKGTLKVSEEVLATVASVAAKEVSGVAELGIAPSIKGIVNKKSPLASIMIKMIMGAATIDVYVVLEYGAKIPQVGNEIQDNVKSAVQNMCNVVVDKVNVFVCGVVKKAEETDEQ